MQTISLAPGRPPGAGMRVSLATPSRRSNAQASPFEKENRLLYTLLPSLFYVAAAASLFLENIYKSTVVWLPNIYFWLQLIVGGRPL